MARVTYVKAAQQRFTTVPVIDPVTGEQKRTPVTDKRTGAQKTTKTGRLIWMGVTVEDKTQPLPNYTCDKCQAEILVGQPYKHVTPKSGPYGGHKRTRCGACPSWQAWDLSSSVPVLAQKIAYDFQHALVEATEAADIESARDEAADEAEALADQREESGQNMEDGFGHETEQSSQLKQDGEDLRAWAEEIRNTDVPDVPEPEEDECDECDGDGRATPDEDDLDAERDDNGEVECENCSGTGYATPEEPTEDQIDAWREEVADAFAVIDECPI